MQAKTEPVSQVVFSVRLANIHCWERDVFSVLWSDPRALNEKPTIIGSSVEFSCRMKAFEDKTLCILQLQ
jgi:hypothetical protein